MESIWKDQPQRTANMRLAVEDLSQTCRRDRYYPLCIAAFCNHCCRGHHDTRWWDDLAIPVHVDAAGQPTFPKHFPNGNPIEDWIVKRMVEEHYATPFKRDAYCTRCMRAFSTGLCFHHQQYCGRDFIVRRIEEHDGRHYVRCRGDEKWFADLENMLGDPVGEDYGELMLLPLLTRKPGICVQCAGPVPNPFWWRCSRACAASHDQEVARRRERREARRAALQIANLHVDG
uniref:Uncharacterized protein n=1 Tax=Setaria viridis TaxID=4556 RepID=A0A4U6WGX0_SETVI|nr:hypothetical protein SEVIR_1G287200v2 [Setaria viridis]